MEFAHDIWHGGIKGNYYKDSQESNCFYIVERIIRSRETGNMWTVMRSAYSSSGIERTDLEKSKLLKDCLDDERAPLDIKLRLDALRPPKFKDAPIDAEKLD